MIYNLCEIYLFILSGEKNTKEIYRCLLTLVIASLSSRALSIVDTLGDFDFLPLGVFSFCKLKSKIVYCKISKIVI